MEATITCCYCEKQNIFIANEPGITNNDIDYHTCNYCKKIFKVRYAPDGLSIASEPL